MRILYIFSNGHEGNGVVEVLKAVLSRLSKYEDIDIGVYTNSKYNKEMKDLLGKYSVTYYYNKGPYITSNFKKSVNDWNSYDLVHIHGVFFLKNMLLARRLNKLGLPYVITPHGNLMENALKEKSAKKKFIFRKLFSDSVLSNASAIHALANEEKNSIEKITGNRNIFVIPNGMNAIPRKVSQVKKKTDEFNVLFVGRLDVVHKGLDLLIDTISDNIDYYLEKKIKFNLVGDFTSKYDENFINFKFKKNPLLRNILIIHGPKYEEDKDNFFVSADIFIHTSRYEGMPIAVLEALSFELPCIVTIGTNMSEVVKKANCGKVINFDKSELHVALKALRSVTKQELVEMGKSGDEYLKKELNWDKITQDYVSRYSKIISSHLN
ncbi:glycosyltransferase family 4 protein [Sporosarcina psychrophila]|uniref:Glycosyltransferase involved in cell wall biosynthesis n=1 Tax=Sporosarcina psychrophila TaxID=1476 RepID=A0ABV2K335_SPOPS